MGAWIGVEFTITPEGIAVLWLPNAIVLAVFLIRPPGQWPAIAAAVMVAEILADTPAFPLWAAVAFGVINLMEVSLAALLIRRVVDGPFGFNRLRSGAAFLLFGPLLASTLAGMLGALVYLQLARADTGFVTLWQLWWFGDALGLLLLTPLIVGTWRWLEDGLPAFRRSVFAEVTLVWLLVIWVALFAFRSGQPEELAYFVKPVWLAPLAIIAALRLGVVGAAATVALIAVLTMAFLINGVHPYAATAPQYAVWLTQEFLAAMALVAIGLAILMREIHNQREALRENERSLQRSNQELEARVRHRTLELERLNRELEDANRKLALIAGTDELTGIANRRQVYDQAKRELARLGQDGDTAAAIMIDLDHFKAVNDRFGHEAGDHVLIAIQAPIRDALRPRDLVGRIGGEEFLVILSGATLEQAVAIAERIRQAIAAIRIPYQGDAISLTASLGVAQWDGAATLDQLVREADEAMYTAKANGRNRVEPRQAQLAS